MRCSIFIASSTTSSWPFSTTSPAPPAPRPHAAGHGGFEAARGRSRTGDDEARHHPQLDVARAVVDDEQSPWRVQRAWIPPAADDDVDGLLVPRVDDGTLGPVHEERPVPHRAVVDRHLTVTASQHGRWSG